MQDYKKSTHTHHTVFGLFFAHMFHFHLGATQILRLVLTTFAVYIRFSLSRVDVYNTHFMLCYALQLVRSSVSQFTNAHSGAMFTYVFFSMKDRL